jgi:hypothetical protein
MALPKIDLPLYTLELPSTGKTVNYRPFLVKEEKILLMALEGGVEDEIHNATLQIIQNCVSDEIDVEKLPSFDVEYIFVNIRMRSIGETTQLRFRHTKGVNRAGENCNHVQTVDVDLREVKVEGEIKPPVIMLTDNVGMKMRYPSMKESLELGKLGGSKVEITMQTILKCIEIIFDGEDMYPAKDQSQQELQDFVDGLNSEQFNKLKEFFDNMPKLKKTIKYHCEKCGEITKYPVEGLSSFFV